MEVITTHINADFDTIASMMAARKLYPGAVLVLPGSKEETVKGFLLQSALYSLEMKKLREIDLDKITRLIFVDIRNASRVGPFRDLIGRPGVDVHVYDHHPEEDADIRGSVEVIKKVGSTTTILVGILKERGIPITED
ncbi:MAG: DHH family phosphoesterase, partial [Candidatus Deferrimicrobiaceae bacterium]